MICIEKLRELYPDWDDEEVGQYIDIHCPVEMDPMELINERWWRRTERERKLEDEAEAKFYRNYQRRFLARPYLTKVEFDCDEEKMLSEMARYTGYSREFIAREAVRYIYDEWFLRQPRDSGPYYKCHEPIVWVDNLSEGSDETRESEEVKMDGGL